MRTETLYALGITLGAFLLFQVQPLAGKYLLPWYGGSAAVWSTCLLFFQVLLFLGYLYAHLVGSRLAPRRQGQVQLALLALSLLFLPLAPGARWKPEDHSLPALRILVFLVATLGLPYLLLSANSPLLQRWFSLRSARTPYRLYSLSNLGSLLGLLSYPFLVEPLLPLRVQSLAWSAGYLLLALTVGACALGIARLGHGAASAAATAVAAATPERPQAPLQAPWLVAGLALVGSLVMAATTHYLSQNVAVVPLLWILPLSLYLVTFIVVFADERLYRRGPFLALLAVTTVAATATLFLGFRLGLLTRIVVLATHLFVACLVLHGELVRLKPTPERLTAYYLLISAGGALGTAFVTFAAPALFPGYWEYHVGLAAGWALALYAVLRGSGGEGQDARLLRRTGAAVASLLALVGALRYQTLVSLAQKVRAERNFYGALFVLDRDAEDPERHRLELTNGGVVHGAQFLAPHLRRWPTAYFSLRSGMGLGLRAARRDRQARGEPETLRIGCVGLGVGVIAAHTVRGDLLRIYEINPAVEEVARQEFSFLADAAGKTEVVLGDARLSLERELERTGPQGFDVLIVDAFTGDAIPAHLLTRECLRLYFAHLKPGGRLLLHISNRYLDLRPLVLGLARDAGRTALIMDTYADQFGAMGATWADVVPDAALYSAEEREAAARSRPLPGDKTVVWTDEYSNLFGLLAGADTLPVPRR